MIFPFSLVSNRSYFSELILQAEIDTLAYKDRLYKEYEVELDSADYLDILAFAQGLYTLTGVRTDFWMTDSVRNIGTGTTVLSFHGVNGTIVNGGVWTATGIQLVENQYVNFAPIQIPGTPTKFGLSLLSVFDYGAAHSGTYGGADGDVRLLANDLVSKSSACLLTNGLGQSPPNRYRHPRINVLRGWDSENPNNGYNSYTTGLAIPSGRSAVYYTPTTQIWGTNNTTQAALWNLDGPGAGMTNGAVITPKVGLSLGNTIPDFKTIFTLYADFNSTVNMNTIRTLYKSTIGKNYNLP